MEKKYVIKIIGAKGEVKNVDTLLKKITNYFQKYNVIIQLFDADMIYGKIHLISAFEHAKRAMDRKKNTTNSLEMETLLYASGERQLKLAIPKMGIKKGKANIALVFLSDNREIENKLIYEMIKSVDLNLDDRVLFGNESTLRNFGIKENEIRTITKAKYEDLILEKVAMVDVIK